MQPSLGIAGACAKAWVLAAHATSATTATNFWIPDFICVSFTIFPVLN
jgi:hypothetical protein